VDKQAAAGVHVAGDLDGLGSFGGFEVQDLGGFFHGFYSGSASRVAGHWSSPATLKAARGEVVV
jgi:hypothetical protein